MDCPSLFDEAPELLSTESFLAHATFRFKNSVESIDIGGIPSVDKLGFFCSFINEAGVAGAPAALPFASFDGWIIGELSARGGGGISTSGSGSGDTDSFEDVSRLENWGKFPFPFIFVAWCNGVWGCISAPASSKVAANGGGAFFLCGFILGDSRTTRDGFRDVVDFRRPALTFLLMLGESLGSMGEVDCE